MNINRQIIDSQRISVLRHEADRLSSGVGFINGYRKKAARAKRLLANELERELRFDAETYYGKLS